MKDLFNYRYVLERDRFAWIDYARGMCILLVCFRHSFEGLINANFPTGNYPFLELMNSSLVTFRMALFFIISGLFIGPTLAKRKYSEYIADRFKIIIYPLLVWGAIQITLQLLAKGYINAKREPIDYLYLIVMPRKIEQFWYLNALFMVGVCYAFLKTVLKSRMVQLTIYAVTLYALGALFYQLNWNMKYELLAYSFIPDMLHYTIFFFIGDAISSFILDEKNKKYLASLKLFLPVSLFFLITHYYYTITNEQHNKGYYVEFFLPVQFLIIALSGCALTVQASFILQRFRILKFLRVIGYHSLYIYLMHVIFTSSVRSILSRLLNISNIPILLLCSVLVGVIVPIIIYNILVRKGMWWLFSLKKPSDEIKFYSKLSLS